MTLSAPRSMLPALTPEETLHSRAVAELIREHIAAAGGWLSFERFMELALYAPGLGYYSAGSVKLGAGGDFVTAPEMSDLFSRCVAQQCAEVLTRTGGEILELGAGTGRMAAVVLESLAAAGVLPDRYAILEVSADLAERQRERLQRLPAALRERVVWFDRLPERPFRGVILANEVLDAIPCRRFTLRSGELRELGVVSDHAAELTGAATSNGGAVADGTALLGESAAARGAAFTRDAQPLFAERDMALSPELAACNLLLRELPQPLPDGYTSEICLRMNSWIASIGNCLERGVLLLFDYGLPRAHFYHPQRVSGTLRCHFKQRAHDDPYINVGVQDITAWVDFTRVAEAAVESGLDVLGFATQAAFLLATGIERFTSAATGTVEQARFAGEARRLLLPGEMGEAFKVMALARAYDASLGGFSLQDLRHSL